MEKVPLVALVVGVTGMAGFSLAEALKSPKALGAPWKVYGSARRDKPTWFPSSLLDGYISFDATDADDTRNKLGPLSNQVTHVFWVAIQVSRNELPDITVNAAMLANVLNVLKSSPTSRLSHVTLQTGTNHYLHPIFYTPHLNLHGPPFTEDLPRLPYPSLYYALEDIVLSHAPSLTYSVHRPSIIIGASSRSVCNMLLTLVTYASICRHEGLVFRYPGNKYTWENFCDMSDTRVLAEQQIWAAVTPHAKNQAFNCTNGDVFAWKSLWKLLCDIFNLEFVPFDESEEFDFVGLMKGKGKVWDEIVEKHGLCKTKLEEITCPFALWFVLRIEFQHVSSMNKSKEFGFFGYANTLKSLGMWVERLREMKIVP
ncbi:hypothetical protein COLO4_16522 [Corchorus olitorius]|uniref:PRISE-like Rossmann-fold domain-containing protein n=1 Tax=Corchorus olitorius TaxID=93759 RepID=A0A1R3JH23_9ROSI|nr:hypothetical protein COLO4_16522 [Corchorus olitorius]